jgi:histidinol dehydrogenase
MKIFYSNDDTFEVNFNELLERGKMDIEGVTSIVSGLLKEIQTDGNKAVKSQIAKFDRWEPKSDAELLVSTDDMAKAYENIDVELRDALHLAYDRIEEGELDELVVANTIPMTKVSGKIKMLSTATMLGEVIRRVHNNESVNSLFESNT